MREGAILTVKADGSTELTHGWDSMAIIEPRFRELTSAQPIRDRQVMIVEATKYVRNKAIGTPGAAPVAEPLAESTPKRKAK